MAWDILEEKEALQTEIGIVFFLFDMQDGKEIDTTDLFKRIDKHAALAKRRGLDKINEAAAEKLARDLQGGAGPAHKAANADNDLPPLSLTLTNFSAEGVKN